MSYNPYGQAPGTGYPAQQTAHAYPPQNNPGAYPPQAGAYPPQAGAYPPQQGAYPPQQGGYPPQQGAYPPSTQPGGYPPAPGGYPPAGGMPQAGGYPPAAGGAGGAIGFESIAKQPPQPPAQNYGAYPPAAAPGGYGAQPPYGAPAQQPPYGAPQQGAYPPQQGGYGAAPQPGHAPPAAHYQPPAGAPQGYGAPQPGYGQAPPHNQAYQQAHQPAHQQSYHGQPTSTSKVTKQLAGMSIKTHGSVKPYAGFNAESDAQVLRKAMKGLGTDEKAIIGVVGYRTNKQRQDILIAYKQAYGRDLIKDLKSEISGNFERLVVGLMTKPAEYDAYCLHKAMSGAGTDESVLVEILASRSNAEIREIRTVYKRDYKKDLEKELSSETSGHFRRLLVSLNNASRDESNTVDPNKAQQDAQNLYQAGEKKWGTDESAFNLVMASRNYSQLRATFDAYHKIANRDITKSLSSEFSGDILKGMLAVVGVARDPPSYFAHQFHKSMKGLGTSDDDLIRAAVTRSEVDMEEVKQRFTQLFHQPLSKYISDDTGGDYKKLLLAIVGN